MKVDQITHTRGVSGEVIDRLHYAESTLRILAGSRIPIIVQENDEDWVFVVLNYGNKKVMAVF